jgi:hypothetical protein
MWVNGYSRLSSSRCSVKSRVKSASYPWEGMWESIAEAGCRFPGRPLAAAFAAHGDRSCTERPVANEASIDPETKIESSKALSGKEFREIRLFR